jgi:protein-S-isoprenylcysteine O-methyltransferase Ste14
MTDQKIQFSPKFVFLFLLTMVVLPFLPLLISWRWDWWEAWVYALIYILGFVISRALAARHHPDLLVERSRFLDHSDAKPWDKLLSPLVGMGGGFILLVVGLDDLFGWSPAFSLWVKIVSLVLIFLGYIISSSALIENRYFSGMVRIQTERGHQVVSGGPYRWVRHPGYAGALITYLATPFFLDSSWAFIPAVLLTVILIIRTSLEDRTLQAELQGYGEYAARVRYRLFPGVW